MPIIDKIALFYIEDGKILKTRSKGKGKYYFPGGKREEGETDIETLIREIKEELNVDILPASVNYYGTFTAQADGKADGIQVQITGYTATFTGTPQPTSEIAEIAWLTFADIEKVSLVGTIVFEDLHNKGILK
jgi:8-oxo-dGTP pyrophosphatase MutT (NUDIX family)